MSELSYFARWSDLAFAGVGLILGIFLLIWWRQQSERWYSIFAGSLFFAAIFDLASFYFFVLPPHQVGCPDGCPGQLGYPLPFALLRSGGQLSVYPLDFVLNLILIWLFILGMTVVARFVAEALEYSHRSRRFKFLFLVAIFVLPMALLPRYFDPPEPTVRGDELRISVNARRAAEMTYRLTGLWIHRLALEDIYYTPLQVPGRFGGIDQPQAQVCLRGYTYFYIPWARYRITLDSSGVTALNMTQLPLGGSCWG